MPYLTQITFGLRINRASLFKALEQRITRGVEAREREHGPPTSDDHRLGRMKEIFKLSLQEALSNLEEEPIIHGIIEECADEEIVIAFGRPAFMSNSLKVGNQTTAEFDVGVFEQIRERYGKLACEARKMLVELGTVPSEVGFFTISFHY